MYKFVTGQLMVVIASAFVDMSDYEYSYRGKHFFSWPAEEKHERLMRELRAEQETIEYPYSSLADLFKQRSNVTTCSQGEDLPTQQLGEDAVKERRQKLMHTKGVVASFKYESLSNRYSGLFEEGSDFGIVRLSESGFLMTNQEEQTSFMPSAALKFIVDGNASTNLLTQVNFDGISDPYFFAEDFTNHPPRTYNECVVDTMIAKFAEASQLPFSTGTSRFAGINNAGEVIDDEDRRFPFEILLKPNQGAFPASDMQDGEDFLDFFSNWTAPEDSEGNPEYPILFEMWARDDCDTEVPEHIGNVHLTSELFRSTFGDERLFFRHEPFNRDLVVLKHQGEDGKTRQRKWWKYVADTKDGRITDKWNDNEIIDLPEDNNEAMEIIEEGMRTHQCPFAWLYDNLQNFNQ